MAGAASNQSATMSHDHSRRSSSVPFGAPDSIPHAPPLPAPRPLQRARDAATRLFGYQSRPPSPVEEDCARPGVRARFASLSATQNATASHKTGLELNTIAINEDGTHALLGGKEIFKTVRVEDGVCMEDLNLRSAIRSNPKQASGGDRQIYSIDIADVAWAKGDCGHYVAAATSSGKIILYDLGQVGLRAIQLHEHFRQVHKVTFNPHRGSLLLSGSQDGTVRLWDLRDVRQASTLKSKHKYSGQSDGVRDVKWSPTEGVDFAFGTDSGWIQRWDIRNLKTAKIKIPAHSTTCNTIDWHPDGKHIVSASSDKAVRVWDFSVSRRQKAGWEIKTPYPVLNARWRPTCESSLPQNPGARQCTQIVTSYDASHPILHIWDFRRPALPFREMAPYSTAPTDLLWHSQDLLWTVGRDGIFLQADIQHAPKVIDKRNLQALAVSPQGDINFVAQKKWRSRLRKQRDQPPFGSNLSQSPEHNVLSRSWADDSLDHSFLSVLPAKRSEPASRSKTGTQSLSMAPSSEQLQIAASIVHLDEILLNRRTGRPIQIACRGFLPGRKDARIVAYLARKYRIALEPVLNAEDPVKAFEDLMHNNARITEAAGFYRLAQSWRIVNFITINHLKERVDYRRKQLLDGRPQIQTPVAKGSLSQVARRIMGEQNKSPAPTPASLRPVSSIARQLALSDSVSSQQTPLARPTSSGKASGRPIRNGLPDLDKDEHLTLPPLMAPTPSTPEVTLNKHPQHDRRLTISNLDGLQKLHQSGNGLDRADMVRKWSVQPKEPLNLDPVDSNGVKIPPPKLEKRDSDESFTFLAGSVDSREPSFPSSFASTGSGPLLMVAERPHRTAKEKRIRGGGTEALDFGNGTTVPVSPPISVPQLGQLSGRPQSAGILTADFDTVLNGMHKTMNMREEASTQTLDPGSYPDENGICPISELVATLPQSKRNVEPAAPLLSPRGANKDHKFEGSTARRSPLDSAYIQNQSKERSIFLPEDDEVDLEENKPFTLIGMLRELVNNYASKGDAQTAAHLLLLLGPLLPRTHRLPQHEVIDIVSAYIECFTAAGYAQEDIEAILDNNIESIVTSGIQPLQCEAVLSTYQEQLMRQRLYNEAAILRKLSFPAYPAVYDQDLKDNYVHLRRGGCGKPTSTGMDKLRCENCQSKQASCPVCWCDESPYDKALNKKSKLLSTCLLCNHSGHTSCLRMWFDESGEGDGGCPTEGCLCDCVAGNWREEKAQMAERKRRFRSHGRVKSDDWAAQESKAVERTREVLGIAAGKDSRAGFSA